MGKEFGSRNIFSLSSMVKSSIGLEKGGQMDLHYITEIDHTSFYTITTWSKNKFCVFILKFYQELGFKALNVLVLIS